MSGQNRRVKSWSITDKDLNTHVVHVNTQNVPIKLC